MTSRSPLERHEPVSVADEDDPYESVARECKPEGQHSNAATRVSDSVFEEGDTHNLDDPDTMVASQKNDNGVPSE